MNRYLIFGYNLNYPRGGTNDLVGNVSTLESFRPSRQYDVLEALDTFTGDKHKYVDGKWL